MLNDLYNEKILGYAADIPRIGRLPTPGGTATERSRLCGSQVTVDVATEDGVVSDFAHEVKACALGQAASSIMAHNVIGATLEELQDAHDKVLAMLKEGGEPPTGRFADAALLVPVAAHKARHASTMLTFAATLAAAKAALVREAA